MPTNLTCEDFGLSQEEMLSRLIDNMADKLLGLDYDPDVEEQEGSYYSKETVEKKLNQLIKERIDQNLAAIAEKHILPKIDELISGLTFQKTNSYGEPKEPSMTIREWLETRAAVWLSEPVDDKGRTKGEAGSYWTKDSSRLVWTVQKHVAYHLNESIKKATQDVHMTFAGHVGRLVADTINSMRVTTTVNVEKP